MRLERGTRAAAARITCDCFRSPSEEKNLGAKLPAQEVALPLGQVRVVFEHIAKKPKKNSLETDLHLHSGNHIFN